MRILAVSAATSAHRTGGLERHLDYLTQALTALGHRVDWLTTPLPDGATAPVLPGGGRVLCAPGARPGRLGPRWWRASREAARPSFAAGDYDLVLSESVAAWGLSSLPGCPPVWLILHGFEPEHWVNRYQETRGVVQTLRYLAVGAPEVLYYSLIEGALARRAGKVLTTAPHILRRARAAYRVAPSKLESFPNWVETERFVRDSAARARLRAEFEAEEEDCVFLFSAVLSRQKGADLALEAFDRHAAEHPRSRLLLVGDGPESGELKRRALWLGRASRVRFLGALPAARMPEAYAAADVFLMPTRRIEGLPFALIEAGAAGLPTVATGKGGNEAVLGERALWVPPGDVPALADAMDRLAEDAALRRDLGRGLQERVRTLFSREAALARLRSLLGGAPR